MNQLHEKAPDALAGDLSAIEINQANLTPDYNMCQEPVETVIPELIEITKRLHELRDNGIIFDIDSAKLQVHVPGNKFPDLFVFGEWEEESYGPEFDKYSTIIQGVEFFCLVEKEDGHVSV